MKYLSYKSHWPDQVKHWVRAYNAAAYTRTHDSLTPLTNDKALIQEICAEWNRIHQNKQWRKKATFFPPCLNYICNECSGINLNTHKKYQVNDYFPRNDYCITILQAACASLKGLSPNDKYLLTTMPQFLKTHEKKRKNVCQHM